MKKSKEKTDTTSTKKGSEGKRSKTLYPALNPGVNPRIRWEELKDIDYLDKLNPDEKEWLNKFMDEYVNASFSEKPLQTKKSQRKDCESRNNARNRDILTRAGANKTLDRIEERTISDVNGHGEEYTRTSMQVPQDKKNKRIPIDTIKETCIDYADELNFQIEIKHRSKTSEFVKDKLKKF